MSSNSLREIRKFVAPKLSIAAGKSISPAAPAAWRIPRCSGGCNAALCCHFPPCGIVDEKQDIGFNLRNQNGTSFAGIEMRQSGVSNRGR
jgi:hypothetical protein